MKIKQRGEEKKKRIRKDFSKHAFHKEEEKEDITFCCNEGIWHIRYINKVKYDETRNTELSVVDICLMGDQDRIVTFV